MASDLITAERLRALLHYDPETGVFTWRVSRHHPRAGVEAGYRRSDGYMEIRLDGRGSRHYRMSRLAWLYVTGEWPAAEIDHIDGVRANNRWSNLREATPSQNRWNGKTPKHNTSGFKGVSWHRHRGKWVANINAHRKRQFLGEFDTPWQAYQAYLKRAAELHGEYARLG